MNNISSAYNYNDLAGLNAITKQSANNEAGALKEVARQFESMFVGMMLKSMRDANAVFEEDNPLFSNESKFYREMFDEQLTLSLSKGKGMGLADTLYRQLKQQFDIKEEDKKSTNEMKIEKAFNLNHQPSPFSSLRSTPMAPKVESSFDEPAQMVTSLASSIPVPLNNMQEMKPKGISEAEIKTTQARVDKPVAPIISKEQTPLEIKASKAAVIKQSGFNTPQDFISTLWPIAQKVAGDMNVEPKAIMAQAALETGWGKHIIHQANGQSSHNLFGIKADRRWNGDVAKVSTLEYRNGLANKEVAPFRVYDSYESSLKDYAHFIQDSERYQGAVKNGRSIKAYSEGLQEAGYATDPNYAKKIQRIAGGDLLNGAINQVKRG